MNDSQAVNQILIILETACSQEQFNRVKKIVRRYADEQSLRYFNFLADKEIGGKYFDGVFNQPHKVLLRACKRQRK